MPRAIWSGTVSFGLVNVPVKLSTAVSKKDVRFHMLHAADGSRIEQRRVCSLEGTEVAYDDLVRGYEWAPGEHVVVTPQELEALDPEATRTIDILDFVNEADIDPVYFQHPYYLTPDGRAAEKAYALLRSAMARTRKVAIARFVMRTKEYLAAVRAVGPALLLSTMLFHDEVLPVATVEDALPPADVDGTDREVEMAERLIESLSTDWEPERYHDRYRERVLELIEAKAAGQEIVAAPAAPQPAAVVDLVAALEASLEEAAKRESA
ncbi:MAG TPA: Ku protein [Acidimicrobiia bacterium]|nr:Ku protein [Acidimicrobiia bacterium]